MVVKKDGILKSIFVVFLLVVLFFGVSSYYQSIKNAKAKNYVENFISDNFDNSNFSIDFGSVVSKGDFITINDVIIAYNEKNNFYEQMTRKKIPNILIDEINLNYKDGEFDFSFKNINLENEISEEYIQFFNAKDNFFVKFINSGEIDLELKYKNNNRLGGKVSHLLVSSKEYFDLIWRIRSSELESLFLSSLELYKNSSYENVKIEELVESVNKFNIALYNIDLYSAEIVVRDRYIFDYLFGNLSEENIQDLMVLLIDKFGVESEIISVAESWFYEKNRMANIYMFFDEQKIKDLIDDPMLFFNKMQIYKYAYK